MGFEEKIKLEPPDDYEPEAKETDPLRDHDYCKNPKLEELMEPKLEEPDYFEMDRPSEKSLESPIFEYPEYLKLESVDDYGSEAAEPTQAQTTNPIEPTNVYSLKKRGVVQAKTARLETRKCSVCSIITERKKLVSTRSTNRKFLLLLGVVLGGQMSVQAARSKLSVGNIMFCPNHYTEAVDEILKFLQINHVHQMNSCSVDRKNAIMTTISSLSSMFSFEQLVQAVCDYSWKTDTLRQPHQIIEWKEIIKKKAAANEWKSGYECSVCSVISYLPLTTVESAARKLILMVGAVLAGRTTVEQAKSHISRWRCFTCHSHLSEAIDKIFKILNIRNIDEMQSCSMDNKKKLMTIVTSLSTEFSLDEFSVLLEIFARNSDF